MHSAHLSGVSLILFNIYDHLYTRSSIRTGLLVKYALDEKGAYLGDKERVMRRSSDRLTAQYRPSTP